MSLDFGVVEAVGLVATAASAVVGAVGSAQQASATSAAANYQAQVAANNAILAKQQAQQTAAAGEVATTNEELKTRATVGAIKAAEAASNVDVNSGSALDVQSSARELGELNALTVRSNYARQAYGYETGATGFTAQSQLDTAEAKQAQTAGVFSSVGSLLGGASGVAKQYSQWQMAAGNSGGNNASAIQSNIASTGNTNNVSSFNLWGE